MSLRGGFVLESVLHVALAVLECRGWVGRLYLSESVVSFLLLDCGVLLDSAARLGYLFKLTSPALLWLVTATECLDTTGTASDVCADCKTFIGVCLGRNTALAAVV